MMPPMVGRGALTLAVVMSLACAGLALVAVRYAQGNAARDARIAQLEDQLEAYRSLAEEQARWAEEWREEKRELIRQQREAQAAGAAGE